MVALQEVTRADAAAVARGARASRLRFGQDGPEGGVATGRRAAAARSADRRARAADRARRARGAVARAAPVLRARRRRDREPALADLAGAGAREGPDARGGGGLPGGDAARRAAGAVRRPQHAAPRAADGDRPHLRARQRRPPAPRAWRALGSCRERARPRTARAGLGRCLPGAARLRRARGELALPGAGCADHAWHDCARGERLRAVALEPDTSACGGLERRQLRADRPGRSAVPPRRPARCARSGASTLYRLSRPTPRHVGARWPCERTTRGDVSKSPAGAIERTDRSCVRCQLSCRPRPAPSPRRPETRGRDDSSVSATSRRADAAQPSRCDCARSTAG